MSDLESLIDSARAWLEQDPDPITRAELEKLISEQDLAGLESRFATRLSFGTAGLRGELGAGPNRMNRVLVSQAAAGIASYLKKNFENPSVVIGFDGRINSDAFAKDSAEIYAGAGIKTYLFGSLAATPLVSYAVRELGCSMGIMVTASHNPPRDNGYKVYDFSGSQIISPTDDEISKEITNFSSTTEITKLSRSNKYERVSPEIREQYLNKISELISENENRKQLKIVYSAMHGVGAAFINDLFAKSGITKPIPVASQVEPDGTFPTVKFPNPEEPGAMDESLRTAVSVGADLILVNDPDADRLAVAFQQNGEYRQLTGDELGLLLGEEIARKASLRGIKGALACSIVSSSALEKVAKHYGLEYHETLTGFKWISRVPDLLFGYEEALGYCVDWQRVRDKDGISAALVVADLAMRLAASGETLGDQLDRLSQRYGYFATSQISIRVQDLAVIRDIMAKLRHNGAIDIAGVGTVFTDLRLGSKSFGPTDAVRFDLADGRRVIIRPSGTEPKLKCYLQAVSDSKIEAKELLTELELAMRKVLS